MHLVEFAFSSRNSRTLIITPTLFAARWADHKFPRLSFLTTLISLSLSVLQKPHHLSFVYSWVCLPSTGHISGAWYPNWSDTVTQNEERTRSSLLDPTESVHRPLFPGLKSHSLPNKQDRNIYLLPKKRDEQGSVRGTCLLCFCPVMKETIHPVVVSE